MTIRKSKISSININVNTQGNIIKYIMYNGDLISEMCIFESKEKLIDNVTKNLKSYLSGVSEDKVLSKEIIEYSFYGPAES